MKRKRPKNRGGFINVSVEREGHVTVGRLFHSSGAVDEKAPSPLDFSFMCGTKSSCLSADLRARGVEWGMISSDALDSGCLTGRGENSKKGTCCLRRSTARTGRTSCETLHRVFSAIGASKRALSQRFLANIRALVRAKEEQPGIQHELPRLRNVGQKCTARLIFP